MWVQGASPGQRKVGHEAGRKCAQPVFTAAPTTVLPQWAVLFAPANVQSAPADRRVHLSSTKWGTNREDSNSTKCSAAAESGESEVVTSRGVRESLAGARGTRQCPRVPRRRARPHAARPRSAQKRERAPCGFGDVRPFVCPWTLGRSRAALGHEAREAVSELGRTPDGRVRLFVSSGSLMIVGVMFRIRRHHRGCFWTDLCRTPKDGSPLLRGRRSVPPSSAAPGLAHAPHPARPVPRAPPYPQVYVPVHVPVRTYRSWVSSPSEN